MRRDHVGNMVRKAAWGRELSRSYCLLETNDKTPCGSHWIAPRMQLSTVGSKDVAISQVCWSQGAVWSAQISSRLPSLAFVWFIPSIELGLSCRKFGPWFGCLESRSSWYFFASRCDIRNSEAATLLFWELWILGGTSKPEA